MARSRNTRVLVFDFVINTVLTIIEVISGVLSGSTAVFADSIQNLTDSVVLTVAYICERVVAGRRLRHAKRANIYRLAGSINAVILIILACYVGLAAFSRTLHPQSVRAGLVIGVGLLSIVVNWIAAAALFTRRHDKTIRAPYIGLIFSGLSGLGVFTSGILTQFFHLPRIDGIVGMIIAIVLLWRSVGLLLRSLYGR